jgi:RNA polymerase sigma factor (sigma-70 family)
MASGPMNRVVRQLRRALVPAGDDACTDCQLLDRFLARRDEAAFAALVRRHGPMVLGVCRRTAGHAEDADDAFQATFLVLARKAASIRAPARLAAWLYGVAFRTARKARAASDRLREREKQVSIMPQPPVEDEDRWREVLPLLDQELSRLPDKYQVPIVLCDLEGIARRDAARELGVPEGTLSSRLATGRRMLARRLARHGLAVACGALAAVLARQAAAAVPAALSCSTVQNVLAYGTATGAASAKVAALAQGVMKAMLWMKLKVAAVVVLTGGLVLAGAGATALLPGQAHAKDDAKAAPAKPAADDPDVKDVGWTLDFQFKSLRVYRYRVAGQDKKPIWYLSYTVANSSDQAHTFIPDFELTVVDKEVHHDRTPSAEQLAVIESAEDPARALDGRVNLKTSVTIAADAIPPAKVDAPKAVAGVAMWVDVDPDIERCSVYVYGLSNGWSTKGGQVRRKTLELNFKRVEGARDGRMELVGEPRWLYIPSHGGEPERASQADDLRLQIANLRKQLENAQYAAAVTDAQKALREKDDEIAALRDQLAASQIEVKALIDRCKSLEVKIEELQKERAKDKAKPDKPAGVPPADAPEIKGEVTKAADGLVVVNVGKDAGVEAGLTLNVYRLKPPLYVGDLRIVEVREREAVGKLVHAAPGRTIEAGDRVTTRFTNKDL